MDCGGCRRQAQDAFADFRAFSLVATGAAHGATAADQSDLLGEWFEHFPNGAAMATVFSSTSVSTFVETRDHEKKRVGTP